MTSASDSPFETCIAVENSSNRQIMLYLEPWGEEFPMAVQTEFVLVGRGPQKGSGFTVEYRDESIVVTGWTGSVVQVFCQGQELGDARKRPPIPDFN